MKKSFHLNAIAAMMPVMTCAFDGDDIGAVLAELRKTNEVMQKKMLEGGNQKQVDEMQTKMDAINLKLDAQETKSGELTLAIESKKAQELEITDKIELLEKQLARSANAGAEETDIVKKELNFLNAFAKKGFTTDDAGIVNIKGLEALTDMERKQYLRSDSNADGGFLMEHSYFDTILKNITEVSPMRQLANVRRIDALSSTEYTRDSLLTFSENGEGIDDWAPSNSKYGNLKIPVHSMQGKVEITNRALLGARFNMENEINSDFSEAQAELQNRRFVNGDGAGKPSGVMQDSRIERINSGIANSFDFDNLISLTGELKTGYNPIYAMNRRTLAFIRTLKDTAGNYIWREGNLGAGIPNQINGMGYSSEFIDMDDIGANAEPVIYADFRRLYTIIDAFNAIMLRNPYKKDGSVIFTIESFYGGQVVLPEAGKILKCAVS